MSPRQIRREVNEKKMTTEWTTAERWYEDRRRYDPSMEQGKSGKPKKLRAIEPVSEPQTPEITLREKINAISLILLIGILCVCIIISTAYVASVRYDINTINRQGAVLQGEIENLNVKIKNATNIKTIEEKAMNELGMIYPPVEKFVFIQSNVRPQGDFAMRLKVQAYNLHVEI